MADDCWHVITGDACDKIPCAVEDDQLTPLVRLAPCWHVVSDDRGFRWESCHLALTEATDEALDRSIPSTIVQHREGCSHLACVEEH